MKCSTKSDSMPVVPFEPVSSLSAYTETVVFVGIFVSISAMREVYAQTLSSCPYAPTIERSKPTSLAPPAGTTSSSALINSLSVIPYFSLRSASAVSFTASFTFSSGYGIEAITTFSSSPLITSLSFLSLWSFAR